MLNLSRLFVKHILFNPIILLVVAGLSAMFAWILIFDTQMYARQAEQVQALTPLQYDDFAQIQLEHVGDLILVEGVISETNPKINGDFVSYISEEYRSNISIIPWENADSPRWYEVTSDYPPLLVALSEGDVQITNDDYLFDRAASVRRDAEPSATEGAKQTRGFVTGDPVLVLGTIAPTSSGYGIDAEFLYGGTQLEYINDMQQTAQRSLPVGLIALVVFLASLGLFIWRMILLLQELRAETAAEEATRAALLQQQQQVRSNRKKKRNA